jgi:hypothetical protein
MGIKYTFEEIKKRCLERGFEFLEKQFKGSRQKYSFRCIRHNQSHEAIFNNIINKNQGLKCCVLSKGFRSEKYTLTEISELASLKNLMFMDDAYVSNEFYHNFKCVRHGFYFKQNWANMNNKKTMNPCCRKERKELSLKKYIEMCKSKNVIFLDSNKFENLTSKYWFECVIHNERFLSEFRDIDNNKIGLRCCGLERLKTYVHLSGPSSGQWNPNLTEEQREGNRSTSTWQKRVKISAGHTCKICKAANLSGRNCIAHHLESYRSRPELAKELSNGVCLCSDCHIKFHKNYGFGGNTAQQFNEFVKSIESSAIFQ